MPLRQSRAVQHLLSGAKYLTVSIGFAFVLAPASFGAAIVMGFNATVDGRNDDGTYTTGGCDNPADGGFCDGTPVPIGFDLNYFGVTRSALYINTNGNVTFDFPLSTFTPFGFAFIPIPIVAPYFVDVDTRNPASGTVTFGNGAFGGRNAFGVNWVDVGYYAQHVDKTNSSQLLIVDRTDTGTGNFDLIFNYDRILYESGDASNGVNGIGGDPAFAGFSDGTGDPGGFVELPGSGVSGALIDSGTSPLVLNSLNSNVAGRYIFNSRQGSFQAVPEPGTVLLFGAAALALGFRRLCSNRTR